MALGKTDRNPLTSTVQALQIRNMDYLNALLTVLPGSFAKNLKKDELVITIAKQLQRDNLKTIWDSLTELDQLAIAEAVYDPDGCFKDQIFYAKYGENPVWRTRDDAESRYKPYPSLLGLFFYDIDRYSHQPGRYLPPDLKSTLRDFVREPLPAKLQTQEKLLTSVKIKSGFKAPEVEIQVRQCDREIAAQQDLMTVLRLVSLDKITVSEKTGIPTAATINLLTPLLAQGDYYSDLSEDEEPVSPIQPFAWLMILQGGGLTVAVGKKVQLTAAGQKALSEDAPSILKLLWKKWLKTRVLDEFRRIDSVKGQTGKGQRGFTDLSKRRAPIENTLKVCPGDRWVLLKDFERYMIATQDVFEVTRSRDTLYHESPGNTLAYYSSDWSLIEESYLQVFLFEYVATMGLIDVLYIPPEYCRLSHRYMTPIAHRYQGFLGFRLNALGLYCLGKKSQYQPSRMVTQTSSAPIESSAFLEVYPNLTIVVDLDNFSTGDRLLLELYTQQVAEAVWELSEQKCLEALDKGHQIAALQTFLERSSGEKLPPSVLEFLKDLDDRSRALQDRGMAILLECANETIAEQLATDRGTQKYCFRVNDRFLVIPIAKKTAFQKGLNRLGYTFPL